MCRESLHNYIYTYTQNEENEDFKQKLKNYNNNYDLTIFNSSEIKQIDRALEDVKICDPAIGSGAFPMGLLHEIYHLKIPIEDSKGLKAKSPADLKKHIIEESIYGVDIDNGAVDIARLRFWLSLVVDETEPQPLPNLAFKIVCANTLIPLGMDNKINIAGATEVVLEIEKVRENYFDASKEVKKDLERKFKNLQNKLWATAKDWVTTKEGVLYQKLLEFNPFEDKSCTWFDAWWMFGVKDGFDIVIGNPPYVEFKNLDSKFKKELELNFVTTKGKYDLYIPFLELPNRILKVNGILSYICPTRFMQRDYGKEIRKFINKNYQINQIIDFGDGQVFENAVTYTGIFIFSKGNKKLNINYRKFIKEENLDTLNNFEFIKLHHSITDNETWYFNNSENDLLPIIFNESEPLENLVSGIVQGVATGKDSVFIVDEAQISALKLETNGLQKILKGKDISPWKINWSNKYLIYPYDKKGNVIPETDFKTQFPNIYYYLVSQKEELQGRSYFDKSNKKWYELWNQRNLEKFHIEKLVTLDNASKNSFALDSNNFIGTTTVYSLIPNVEKINIKYLLCVLNSKVLNYYHKRNTIPQAGGFYRYQALFIKGLPIKLISKTQQITFITLVDYLLYLQNNNSEQIFSHSTNERIASNIEEVLNMMVYELYFEEHMKQNDLDVLQYIQPKPIDILDKDKAEVIKNFYLWLQTADNKVRQRINSIDIKSPDVLSVINSATK